MKLSREVIKEFLKPERKKIILFVFLIGFFFLFFGDSYRMALCDPCGCYNKWGYPFSFFKESAVGARIKPFSCGTKVAYYSYSDLIFDLLFWYFISCLIIFASNKLKNKSNFKPLIHNS